MTLYEICNKGVHKESKIDFPFFHYLFFLFLKSEMENNRKKVCI